MNVGIVGTGNMGRALGLGWARAGHPVLFGSADPGKAAAVAAAGTDSTRAGDLDAAAAFGDVILYTVRDVLPSALLRNHRVLDGKIVIDCRNSAILGLEVPDPDNRPGVHFTTPVPSIAERLAADVPEARVVKAFNTVPSIVIELGREALAPHRISIFLCSDDPASKSVVRSLAEQLGFVGIDSGELERSRLVEAVADFIRYQTVAKGMGMGSLTTISVRRLDDTRDA